MCNTVISNKLTRLVLKRNAPDKRKQKKGFNRVKFNPDEIRTTKISLGRQGRQTHAEKRGQPLRDDLADQVY